MTLREEIRVCVGNEYKRAAENTCQFCKHRVKFNRRSGCKIKGVEKTIGCFDRACDSFEDNGRGR